MSIKTLLVVLGFAVSALSAAVAENGPADTFLDLYRKFGSAQKAETEGKDGEALKTYREVDEGLERLATDFPEWNPAIIKYRRGKAADAMKRILERSVRAEARPQLEAKPEPKKDEAARPDDQPKRAKPAPLYVFPPLKAGEGDNRTQWEEMLLHRSWLLEARR